MTELLNSKLFVQMRGLTKYTSVLLVLWIGTLTLYLGFRPELRPKLNVSQVTRTQGALDNNAPLIFVGGLPRSGTTLSRVMLDAHPNIRCGEETRVLPRILRVRMEWTKTARERSRLAEAGLSDQVLDSAVAAFIRKIIEKHGEPADYLCNKDPFTMRHSVYLSKLFPNAKFILMVRDGRAVVNSIISRRVTVSGFDFNDPKKCLERWNGIIESMYNQCLEVGPARCMPVYYEQLSLHPELWMHRILEFLDIPWSDNVLHHQDFIGKPGGASLSQLERSTDQVMKPINLQALSKWVGSYPRHILEVMPNIAPMLRRLGYDPLANPPRYDQPDPRIADNTLHISQYKKLMRNKGLTVAD